MKAGMFEKKRGWGKPSQNMLASSDLASWCGRASVSEMTDTTRTRIM